MKKLYVGNLAHESSDADLRVAFEAFGEIGSVTLITDRLTGQSRGFGFVEMLNDAEAAAAISGLNGKDLHGRTLNVNEARTDKRSSGGPGRRDQREGGRRW